LPEVRDDLVMAVKKGLQAGTYKPDPAKIADGVLEMSLLLVRR
jgi:anti-sigma28 factor (negative regulator of flagellin synthesis)